MNPLRWIILVAAVACLALCIARLSTSPSATSTAAAAGDPGTAPERDRSGSQIELLGGPPTRKDDGAAEMGGLQRDSSIRADQRRERLREVLGNLENSAVWVEGIDGVDPATVGPGAQPPR